MRTPEHLSSLGYHQELQGGRCLLVRWGVDLGGGFWTRQKALSPLACIVTPWTPAGVRRGTLSIQQGFPAWAMSNQVTTTSRG